MDTDDLTPMAYECILFADEASDVLMTELGVAASKFMNEGEYLNGIQEYVKEIEDDSEDYLDACNLLEEIDLKRFKIKLSELRKHIEKTINTPFEERGELIDWRSD